MLALIALSLLLQVTPNGPPALAGPLNQLAPLAGSCWLGAPEERDGTPDMHCFELSKDGNQVTDRHIVPSNPPYCGETIYQVDGEALTYVYTNSAGGRSEGTVVATDEGLRFGPETYTGADGSTRQLETLWRRGGINSYLAETFELTENKRERVRRTLFVRQPESELLIPVGYKTCRQGG